MSHFYGTVQGNRGEGTRAGHKNSGLETYAASYRGAIYVRLDHDEATGKDRFTVSQTIWQGAGIREEIASGVIGESSAEAKRASELARVAEGTRRQLAALSEPLPDEEALVEAMRAYGGSFAKHIAGAWTVADSGNKRALRAAFADLLEGFRPFIKRAA